MELPERYAFFPDDDDDQGGEMLIMALPTAKVSLQQGLSAAEQLGKPISAKFEIEDRNFRLSVYTAEDENFSEVLVDYMTGNISTAKLIADAEDLAEAKLQSEQMTTAKSSLSDAVERAIKENSDSSAVSVTPIVKDGHLAASILLVQGKKFKTVAVSLE